MKRHGGLRSSPILRSGFLNATTIAVALALGACSRAPEPGDPLAAADNFVSGYPAFAADGLVHVVIEIPAGTNAKWEVTKTGEALEWELEDGRPRVIQYLAYPANYGMVPGTLLAAEEGGDGDPIDVILLGPAVTRGAVLQARPIGVLLLVDQGERDDKVVAVQTTGPFSELRGLDELRTAYPGVLTILETWFSSYKGAGEISSEGFAGRGQALDRVRRAAETFTRRRG